MLTKQLAVGLVAMLIFTSSAPSAFAEQGAPQDMKKLAEIKKKVASTNDKTQVTVTLLDTTVVKGRVSQVTDQGFFITPTNNATGRVISYNEVMTIKSPFPKKILFVAIGAVAAVIIVIKAVGIGCGCR